MHLVHWGLWGTLLAHLCLCNAFSSPSFQGNLPISGILANNNNNDNDEMDTFDIFVKMRTGLGSGNGSNDIVFWTGEGELYEAPSGKLLAKLDGFEVSRATYMDENKGHVRIFSRKIFWYRDVHTKEVMKEYDGQQVNPIKYDWQVFDLTRGSSNEKDPFLVSIIPKVIKSPRAPPLMPITPQLAGSKNQILFQVPLFIDLEIPGGRGYYRAWEFYDYFIDSNFPTNRPPSLAWTRNGANPPFVNDEKGVMHFHGYRVDSFDNLPEHLQHLVKKEYPIFIGPPKNMEEVDALIAEANKSR